MEENIYAISLYETFRFTCDKTRKCFNKCCSDINQFLTPYDVLRLKKNLEISSRKFLKLYTIKHMGPETGLPVVTFAPGKEKACPFVTEKGCSVYTDRPSSCRMYPVMRLASINRKTKKITEHYAVIKENHCFGFKKGEKREVRQWLFDQGVLPYNEANDWFMEIISAKNSLKLPPLDAKQRDFVYMACYDIDAFKTKIFSKDLPKTMMPASDTIESIKNDDLKLLKFGFECVKKAFFQYAAE